MKNLILIPLFFILNTSFAQNAQDDENYNYAIITQLGYNKTLYDFGSKNDAKNKEMKSFGYKNLIDALTHLINEGWEIHTFTSNGIATTNINNILMRKSKNLE